MPGPERPDFGYTARGDRLLFEGLPKPERLTGMARWSNLHAL